MTRYGTFTRSWGYCRNDPTHGILILGFGKMGSSLQRQARVSCVYDLTNYVPFLRPNIGSKGTMRNGKGKRNSTTGRRRGWLSPLQRSMNKCRERNKNRFGSWMVCVLHEVLVTHDGYMGGVTQVRKADKQAIGKRERVGVWMPEEIGQRCYLWNMTARPGPLLDLLYGVPLSDCQF